MEESYQRARRSVGDSSSKVRATWLGDFAWSPMAWILLGLFALAEVGNWHMGNEIARVCELLGQGDFASSPATLAKVEIEDICRNRTPQKPAYSVRG
jgi:hypothetical protein